LGLFRRFATPRVRAYRHAAMAFVGIGKVCFVADDGVAEHAPPAKKS